MQIICKWIVHGINGKIRFSAPLNMGVDIGIFLLSSHISILEPEVAISVMADLICILCKLHKVANRSSCSFWIRTYQRYKICTQKNVVGTPKQASPDNRLFTTGLIVLVCHAGAILNFGFMQISVSSSHDSRCLYWAFSYHYILEA